MTQQTIDALVFLAWLAGAAAFVLGLHQMNSPATARRGNQVSAAGMALAVLATFVWLLTPENPIHPGGLSTTALGIIVGGFIIGGGLGLWMARRVAMTAMPQLVSLFNAVGGGAAALVAIDDFLRLSTSPNSQAGVSDTIFVVLGAVIGSARPLVALVLEFPSPVARHHKDAGGPYRPGQRHVAVLVADHVGVGKVDVVFRGGSEEQSRAGLAAVASLPIGWLARGRVVRAVVDTVEPRALASQLPHQPLVDLADHLLLEITPRNSRLVRHEDGQ